MRILFLIFFRNFYQSFQTFGNTFFRYIRRGNIFCLCRFFIGFLCGFDCHDFFVRHACGDCGKASLFFFFAEFLLFTEELQEGKHEADSDAYEEVDRTGVRSDYAEDNGQYDDDDEREYRKFRIFDDIFAAETAEQSVYDASECGVEVRCTLQRFSEVGDYRKAEYEYADNQYRDKRTCRNGYGCNDFVFFRTDFGPRDFLRFDDAGDFEVGQVACNE